MVSAYFAQGAQLQIGDGGSPETFATIPGCGTFSGPGKTRDTVDTTSHSSTGGYREFITGLRDGGEISCDVNWLFDDPAQNALDDAFASDEPVNFRMVYPFTPLNETFSFAGLVTDLSDNAPIDAQFTKSLTIKITGPVTQSNDES